MKKLKSSKSLANARKRGTYKSYLNVKFGNYVFNGAEKCEILSAFIICSTRSPNSETQPHKFLNGGTSDDGT